MTKSTQAEIQNDGGSLGLVTSLKSRSRLSHFDNENDICLKQMTSFTLVKGNSIIISIVLCTSVLRVLTVKQARKHIRPNHGRWKSSATTDKLGWRYSGGVRRGSNTQVYSSAIKFKIGYVGFSTCSHEKFKPEMYKIVLNKGALRSCSSFLILFWVFCGCHKITTVIYFFWTIFTGFLPVS